MRWENNSPCKSLNPDRLRHAAQCAVIFMLKVIPVLSGCTPRNMFRCFARRWLKCPIALTKGFSCNTGTLFYEGLSGTQDQSGHKRSKKNLHPSDTRDRTSGALPLELPGPQKKFQSIFNYPMPPRTSTPVNYF